MAQDFINWHAQLQIQRWDEAATKAANDAGFTDPTPEDFHTLGLLPYNESTVDNNLLTTAGVTRVVNLLNGGGALTVTTTTARVGAGNGAGTAAVGDTDLSAAAGSANRWFQNATVSISAGVLTAVAVFGVNDGNFAWNEWGIDVTASNTSGNTVGTILLNHKTSIAQGTKASGQTWTATATITIS